MSGQNEFKLRIGVADVVSITNRAADNTSVQLIQNAITSGASLEDLRTIEVLNALSDFMKERRCEPGFELELI
jgi:hypothetical protein